LPDELDLDVRPFGVGQLMSTRFCNLAAGQVNIFRPSMRRQISSFPVSDIRTYGYCAPLHTMRLVRRPDWKTFAPVNLSSPSQAPVSTGMLRSLILSDQRGNLLFIEMMKRVGLEVFVIEAPRPFRHHPVFTEGVSEEIALFVDEEYRRVMRAALGRRSVTVVEVPRETYDSAGFTHEKYKTQDPQDFHHGNLAFGRLMLSAIIDHLLLMREKAAPAPLTHRTMRPNAALAAGGRGRAD
jgi:hypothetical protein